MEITNAYVEGNTIVIEGTGLLYNNVIPMIGGYPAELLSNNGTRVVSTIPSNLLNNEVQTILLCAYDNNVSFYSNSFNTVIKYTEIDTPIDNPYKKLTVVDYENKLNPYQDITDIIIEHESSGSSLSSMSSDSTMIDSHSTSSVSSKSTNSSQSSLSSVSKSSQSKSSESSSSSTSHIVNLIIGGSFTYIDGVAKNGLAAASIYGFLVTTWKPDSLLSSGAIINTIVKDNDHIYLGGKFTVINDSSRSGLAAVDINGDLLDWGLAVSGLDATINCMFLVPQDIKLNTPAIFYVGGSFNKIGGTSRSCLANLTIDNVILDWNPVISATSAVCHVYSMAKNGNVIYLAGNFNKINTDTRNFVGAVDIHSNTNLWQPKANDVAYAIAFNSTTQRIYIGGHFSMMSNLFRNRFAVVKTDGLLDSYNANFDGDVNIIVSYKNVIYVGGGFNSIGSENRSKFAAFNLNLTLMSTDLFFNNTVYAIEQTNNDVIIGGSFTNVNGNIRNRIAMVDATTFLIKSFSMNINGDVKAVVQ